MPVYLQVAREREFTGPNFRQDQSLCETIQPAFAQSHEVGRLFRFSTLWFIIRKERTLLNGESPVFGDSIRSAQGIQKITLQRRSNNWNLISFVEHYSGNVVNARPVISVSRADRRSFLHTFCWYFPHAVGQSGAGRIRDILEGSATTCARARNRVSKPVGDRRTLRRQWPIL